MLRNYLIIALRNLFRQKIYSVINIGGLAIGIACSVLLGLYVQSEFSYNKFHANAENIVVGNLIYDMGDGTKQEVHLTPSALLPTMKEKVAEVKRGSRLYFPGIFKPVIFSYEDVAFQEKGFCYADSAFFQMFSFNLIKGDANSVLDDPNNIVLTESSKLKYFGDDEAIGKLVLVDGKPFTVAGIAEDVPSNSSIKFDMVAPFHSYWKRDPIWYSANFLTYLELNNEIAPEILSSKVQTELRAQGLSEPGGNGYFGFGFTPFLDIHLYSDVHQGGDVSTLYVFATIALLILLIAIINYTNLATARSFYRAKEVGLRKTLGAYRSSVITQLIGESLITTFIAMVLALVLVKLLLPFFTLVSGAIIDFTTLTQPKMVIGLTVLYLLITVLSGIYPAIKMAKFNPVDILKGQYVGTRQGSRLRKSLIVIQFFISLSLIIATIIIYNQLGYINQKELGYNKDNLVVLPVSDKIIAQASQFKLGLEQSGLIESATIAGETPTNIQGGYSLNLNDGRSLGVVAAAIDETYIKTTGVSLLAGRTISINDIERARSTKEYSFIINESTADLLGWTSEEAVGEQIELNGRSGVVQGVIKNFHFRALYEEVTPLVLFTENEWAYNYALIRINSNNLSDALGAIEANWKQIDEKTPFSYSFLEEEFNELHLNATRSAELLTAFALLAVLIASLGLFGIVSFSMVQRAKEIGVRKVLGASVSSVLVMTNKEFLILIFIAFIFAAPITYWIMNEWLSGFAYHISIGVFPIIGGLVITLIVAVGTISFESAKAALLNPINTLRNE